MLFSLSLAVVAEKKIKSCFFCTRFGEEWRTAQRRTERREMKNEIQIKRILKWNFFSPSLAFNLINMYTRSLRPSPASTISSEIRKNLFFARYFRYFCYFLCALLFCLLWKEKLKSDRQYSQYFSSLLPQNWIQQKTEGGGGWTNKNRICYAKRSARPITYMKKTKSIREFQIKTRSSKRRSWDWTNSMVTIRIKHQHKLPN